MCIIEENRTNLPVPAPRLLAVFTVTTYSIPLFSFASSRKENFKKYQMKMCDGKQTKSEHVRKKQIGKCMNIYIYIVIKPTIFVRIVIISDLFGIEIQIFLLMSWRRSSFFVPIVYLRYVVKTFISIERKECQLPVVAFDAGFLFGSSSRLVRLSSSFLSSQRPTGNLQPHNEMA